MNIDANGPIPVYHQLKLHLLEEILSGRYSPGDQLPTEAELCRVFGISRTPVGRALSELAAEGVIVRYRSRGTFVNTHWAHRNPAQAELRVLVPEGPWEALVRGGAPSDLNLTLSVVPLPELRRALKLAVAEGQAPDVAVLDSVWVPEFASAGFLWPLEDLDEDWLTDSFQSDALGPLSGANTHGGRTYAAAAEADVAGLWYRRDVFDAADLEAPTTWTELADVARGISKHNPDIYPLVMSGGCRGGEATTYSLLAWLASNNATVLDAEAVTLDSGRTVDALRFLRTLIVEDLMPREVVSMSRKGPIRLLADGDAAMSFGGSYEARILAESSGVEHREIPDRFGFVPIPGAPKGAQASLAGGMVYGVFKQAVYPALAMRLIEYLVAPEALAEMSRETAQIPPRRSALSLIAGDPMLATTADMLKQASIRPSTPEYARVSVQLQTMLESVLTGRMGPASATEHTALLIAAITGLPVQQGFAAEPGTARIS